MEKVIPNKRKNEIDERITSLEKKTENDLYRIERELFLMHQAISYRFWEFNHANNEILYNLLLKNL